MMRSCRAVLQKLASITAEVAERYAALAQRAQQAAALQADMAQDMQSEALGGAPGDVRSDVASVGLVAISKQLGLVCHVAAVITACMRVIFLGLVMALHGHA